jgi:hypothetical protein
LAVFGAVSESACAGEIIEVMDSTKEQAALALSPELNIWRADEAISRVNRWLQSRLMMSIQVSQATFDPLTYCWHLPVHLAFADTGSIGIVGDVYLHAVSEQLISIPDTATMQANALALVKLHRMLKYEDEGEECPVPVV